MKTDEIDVTAYEKANRNCDAWREKFRDEMKRMDDEIRRKYQAKVSRKCRAVVNEHKGRKDDDHWWFNTADVRSSIDHSKSPWQVTVHVTVHVSLYVKAGVRGRLELDCGAGMFEEVVERLRKIVDSGWVDPAGLNALRDTGRKIKG